MIEQTIFDILSNNAALNVIFNGNISPLSGKKSTLPAILYQLFQADSVQTKNSGELMGEYLLKIHVFSEKYSDVVSAVSSIRNLLDFKEIVDDDTDEVIIDMIRFKGFTEDYKENDEVFNRTLEFEIFKY
jgi:hypothetical protein